MITYLLTHNTQECLHLKKKKKKKEGVREKERNTTFLFLQGEPSWFSQAGRYAAKEGNYCNRPFASWIEPPSSAMDE